MLGSVNLLEIMTTKVASRLLLQEKGLYFCGNLTGVGSQPPHTLSPISLPVLVLEGILCECELFPKMSGCFKIPDDCAMFKLVLLEEYFFTLQKRKTAWQHLEQGNSTNPKLCGDPGPASLQRLAAHKASKTRVAQ